MGFVRSSFVGNSVFLTSCSSSPATQETAVKVRETRLGKDLPVLLSARRALPEPSWDSK